LNAFQTFQVRRKGITLNPKLGERVVLIKNNGGDWGIVSGYWKGMRKGVAGTRRKLLTFLLNRHVNLNIILPTNHWDFCSVFHFSKQQSYCQWQFKCL